MNLERNKAIAQIVAQIVILRDKLGELTDHEVDGLEFSSANWQVLAESELAIQHMEDAWDCLPDALSDLTAVYAGGVQDAKTH